MGIKFYRTFGQIQRPRSRRHPIWRWLPLILAPVIVLSVVSVAVLFLNVYRGDYRNTRMLDYERSLSFGVDGSRFQVGQRVEIAVSLANPGPQAVTIQRITVQVPPQFLDGFTVDDARCTVERKADASGSITCARLSVPAQKSFVFNVAMAASRPGNYAGDLSANLELDVPAPDHPWYVPVDAGGNYRLVLERTLGLELRVVP